jgi:hypothetical protein
MIDHQIVRDLKNKRFYRFSVIQIIPVLPHSDEAFLYDIISHIGRSGPVTAKPVKGSGITTEQYLQRIRIGFPDSRNDIAIGMLRLLFHAARNIDNKDHSFTRR